MMRSIAAVAAAAIIAIAAAPAGATARFTTSFAADGATIVRQPDPASDLIGVQLRVAAGLDRQLPAQNGLAALVAESILQTPVTGTTLRAAVAAAGGSLSYDVDPHDVRFYLEGLPAEYPAMLDMLRSALAHPDFSGPVLLKARSALAARIAQTQTFALSVGLQMLNRTFYTDSDAGMPPLGIPQTLAALGSADAKKFFAARYLRGGAIVSAVGKTDSLPPDALNGLLGALAPGTSLPAKVEVRQLTTNTRQLIARRDIPVPWLVAQYKAPSLRSPDFGPMLVLTAFLQRTLGDVAGVPGLTTSAQRGVGTIYNFDSRPANVVVYIDGGGDPTRIFATALTIVNVLGHARLQGSLDEMKSYAAGRFLEQSTSLRTRAWLASVFAAQHLPPDFVQQSLAAINRTTAAGIQRAAAKYLGTANIALVLPRDTPTR